MYKGAKYHDLPETDEIGIQIHRAHIHRTHYANNRGQERLAD